MNETKTLAHWIAELKYEKLTPEAIQLAKNVFLDWLGVAIAGSDEIPARLLRQAILPHDRGEEATILAPTSQGDSTCGKFGGTGQPDDGSEPQNSIGLTGSALNAAMMNGAASHTLDFDDLHNPSIIHLATVVVPPALALAEAEGKSGRNLITALAAGYELGARVGESVLPDAYFYWHSTGSAGTLAAAGSAAKILDLDELQTLQTIGSAGTQAAGLWDFLKDGAMSKPLHTAKACYAGVLSAWLAREGFTASTTILEGEKGFCRAMMRIPDITKLTEGLGEDYKIAHNSFKPYPCCKHSHAAIFGIGEMMKAHQLTAADIENVTISVNNMTDTLINNAAPLTPYGCKFSIQYCVASMIVRGHVTVVDFREQEIIDKSVRHVMEKVTVIKDTEMEAVNQAHPDQLASALAVKTADGRVYTQFVPYPKGDPENAMTFDDLAVKFTSLTEPVLGKERAKRLIELVRNLEQVSSMTGQLDI